MMNKEMMDAVTARIGNTIKIPSYETTRKKNCRALPSAYIKARNTLPSAYVKVKNTRTGYIQVMSRAKAFRYVNNRPSLWSITNPIVSFKDSYELAA